MSVVAHRSSPTPAFGYYTDVPLPVPLSTPSHKSTTGDAHACQMTTPPSAQKKADSLTLKRAFATSPNTSFPSKKCEHTFALPHLPPSPPSSQALRWPGSTDTHSPRSGQPVRFRRPSMVQASSRTFVPMPSFSSVFGEEHTHTGPKDVPERSRISPHGSSSHVSRPASSGNTTNGAPFSSFHAHRDSRDSTSTASSDNSPTTTISTMDSSSVTDPSPGPSPESPVAKTAPSSFVADFRSRRTDHSDSSPSTFFELQRPTTPAKKPRNLKNLGINTASSLSNLRSNTTAPLPIVVRKEKNSSAPPSPSFIKPPTPPKRRPSNLSLTISTPGSNENKPMRLIIPSTPAGSRPALRHFQSSPSLPLCSPCVAPSGGMQLPSLRPLRTNSHGLAEVPFEQEEEDQEPNFDIPQSREEKPAAYPNGPICIYDSGVYLYFEPTAEQACSFDVIVNVASEVKNPFTTPASKSQKDLDARRIDGPPAENVDFAALSERTKPGTFGGNASSPTTPKATPVLATTQQPAELVVNGKKYKTPEYVHMPWEHNTDIVSDLFKLVKTMDERVQQGKRVLVHCQCGVSRSASLIVAYGLYKDPSLSVQAAYDLVKKRSKWIGPNMNLIMQLQEFRNGLIRTNDSRSHHALNFGRRSAGLPTGVSTGTNRHSPFDRDVPSGSRTPRTAPLPPESDMGLQRASTGNMFAISPGPLSAPSGAFSPGFRRSWASSQTHFELSPKSSPAIAPYVDPKGHIVPVLSITNNDQSSLKPVITSQDVDALSDQEASLKPLPVPNFSRQLRLRQLDGSAESTETTISSRPEGSLAAPLQSFGFGALRSPAVPSFNIPSLAPDHTDGPPLLSPGATEFSLPPWPKGYDTDSPSISESADSPPPPPMSPRFTEFQIPSPRFNEANDPHEPLSPRATTFDFGPSSSPLAEVDTSQEVDTMSPTATEFPKDIFPPKNDVLDVEMTSPRATEFHMTPLKPRVADEDPFGLTSPSRYDFPSNPFGKTLPLHMELDFRRPSFQAILPPSHLAQPESVNGFASLNGTAQVQPTINLSKPVPKLGLLKSADTAGRVDSLSTSLQAQVKVAEDTPMHDEEMPPKGAPVTPKSWRRSLLSTPPRQSGVRTRFSSPNMRDQRRLHKIQTEMEAMLPHKAPVPHQTADDLDALRSPRAEEFTRNPFHVDLQSPVDDSSPASSNETIKEDEERKWTDAQQWTPQKTVQDPRSPVQTGSSPIVRNIWDVL